MRAPPTSWLRHDTDSSRSVLYQHLHRFIPRRTTADVLLSCGAGTTCALLTSARNLTPQAAASHATLQRAERFADAFAAHGKAYGLLALPGTATAPSLSPSAKEARSSIDEGASPFLCELFPRQLSRKNDPHVAGRPFAHNLFPNAASAQLVLERRRGDGLFDSVFSRYERRVRRATVTNEFAYLEVEDGEAFTSQQHRTVASPSEQQQQPQLLHPLLGGGAQLHTAMDAARLLVPLLAEAAVTALPASLSARVMMEQAFLSLFFTGEDVTTAVPHSSLRQLLSTAYGTRSTIGSSQCYLDALPQVLREALEFALARLLLASPFSLHVALEHMRRQLWVPASVAAASASMKTNMKTTSAAVITAWSDEVVVTLFTLWWAVNPDLAPVELKNAGAAAERLLPTTFDGMNGKQGLPEATTAARCARLSSYKDRVMMRMLREAGKMSSSSSSISAAVGLFTLSPWCLYPPGHEEAYSEALAAATARALANGEAKLNVTCPLVPRVVYMAVRCESACTGRTTPPPIVVHLIESIHSAGAMSAASPSSPLSTVAAGATTAAAPYESWLTLFSFLSAVALLESAAPRLRRLPRRGLSWMNASAELPVSYENALAQVQLAFSGLVSSLVAATSSSAARTTWTWVRTGAAATMPPSSLTEHMTNCGYVSSDVNAGRTQEWTRLLFATARGAVEGSGVLSVAAAHRPLTQARLWCQLQRTAAKTFPRVIHAGCDPTGTLLALMALEGAAAGGFAQAGRSSGGAGRATSVSREVSMLRWRRTVAGADRLAHSVGTSDADVLSSHASVGHRRRTDFILRRVLTDAVDRGEESYGTYPNGTGGVEDLELSGQSTDAATGEEDSDASRHEQLSESAKRRPLVSHAAKDIFYPPHTFAVGCPTVSTPHAGETTTSFIETGSEALAALLDTHEAAMRIARDHFALPVSVPTAVTGVSSISDTVDEAQYAAWGRPSFFVLLKLLQLLGTIGEMPSAVISAATGNAVADYICSDIVPVAPPTVATYVTKIAVQSLIHSADGAGASALLTTRRELLDRLDAESAWERVVVALLWSGLPTSAAERLMAVDTCDGNGMRSRNGKGGNIPGSRKSSPQPPVAVFGAGSLAWRILADDFAAAGSIEKSSGSSARNGGETQTAPSPSPTRTARCLAIALAHLLVLAYEIPNAGRGVTSFLAMAPLLRLSAGTAGIETMVDSIALNATKLVATTTTAFTESATDMCDSRDDDDEDAMAAADAERYFALDDELLGATDAGAASDSSGVKSDCVAAEAAGDETAGVEDDAFDAQSALPGEEQLKENASVRRISTSPVFKLPMGGTRRVVGLSKAAISSLSSENEVRSTLRSALAGCPPAARHLYVSFLLLVGAAVTPHRPESILKCAAGYRLLCTAAFPPGVSLSATALLSSDVCDKGNTMTASATTMTRHGRQLVSSLRRPTAVLRLMLFHLHTHPDPILMAALVHRWANMAVANQRRQDALSSAEVSGVRAGPTGTAGPHTPPHAALSTRRRLLLHRSLLSPLCQLLVNTGVHAAAVRTWRVSTGLSCEPDAFLAEHRRALLTVLDCIMADATTAVGEATGSPPRSRNRECARSLCMLMGSYVLEAVSPHPHSLFAAAPMDGRDACVVSFLGSDAAIAGRSETHRSPEKVGVVLPSQQLVHFALSASMGSPQRAQTWTESKRRVVNRGQRLPLGMAANPDAIQAALRALEEDETNNLTSLFRHM